MDADNLESFYKKIFFGAIPEYFQLMIKRERERKDIELHPIGKQNFEELNHFEYVCDLPNDMSEEMLLFLKNATPAQHKDTLDANSAILAKRIFPLSVIVASGCLEVENGIQCSGK